MSKVKRFPQKRGAPKLKPCCGQCGRELAGPALRERNADFRHELQDGVRLKLRIFARDTNPHGCGIVELDLSEREFLIRWLGDLKSYVLSWDDFLSLLTQWENEGCQIVQTRPALEVHFGATPEITP